LSVDNKRLRRVRDAILRYAYERGAGMPYFSVDYHKLQADLGITSEEFSSATMLMMNQGLLPGSGQGIVGTLGLSERGQAEAESLGPDVLLREPTSSQTVHINAAYSVVQVAGAGSTLTASLQVDQSSIEAVLKQIEAELPKLPINPATREQAEGLVASLRQGLAAKIGHAGLRAIGAALTGILSGAGSALGKGLAGLLGIGPG
jgi:hypothetical protein